MEDEFEKSGADRAVDLLAELKQIKAELTALQEQVRWIQLGERLPEEDIYVLVSNGMFFWRDRYLQRSKRWENIIEGGGRSVVYTHWKPIVLPKE